MSRHIACLVAWGALVGFWRCFSMVAIGGIQLLVSQ
jgi:hypothetical protein